MSLNRKKPLTLVNKTHYFDPKCTRVKNTFLSPYSYKFRQNKIEGYESRLYWQYKYCEDVGGQTFFYTLTYNDEHIPKYFGKSVFDYHDLRSLLHGAFWKKLERDYGTKMKYFVGAELGDGKGSRGFQNNPHYHVLFFLEPSENREFPYKVISPTEFRSLLRTYWQGFDQDKDGFQDFRSAKFGIVKEGKYYLGKVTDFRACMYCAKYVTKDVNLVKMEKDILLYWTLKYQDEFLAKEKVKEFRNRYTNKVRISHGVGDYALKHIDCLDPYIKVPCKDGFKSRPVSLYYFRKLFCDVVKDEYTHNNRYILNEKGIVYKVSNIKRQIYKESVRSLLRLKSVINSKELFDKIVHSDINLNVPLGYSHSVFCDDLKFLSEDHSLYNICYTYATFKFIYSNRFYRLRRDRHSGRHYHPILDSSVDYFSFISCRVDNFKSSPCRDFLEDSHSLYLPYESHPTFLSYRSIFAVLDLVSDYLFVKVDDEAQKKAEEIAKVKRFHDKLELSSFYNQFVFV